MKEVLRPTVIACDIDDEMTESEDSMLFTRTRMRIGEKKSFWDENRYIRCNFHIMLNYNPFSSRYSTSTTDKARHE